MSRILILGLVLMVFSARSQTKIEKTFPVKQGQKLLFDFEDPNKIKIHTWDKNEVSVAGTVSINHGENDNAFDIGSSTDNNTVTVKSILKDKENIPTRLIIKFNDQEYYFKTNDWNDPEVQKFVKEHGGNYSYTMNGIIKDINLEIYVPKGMETMVDAKFGIVEVTNFSGPLAVEAKFGGVDATVTAALSGELTARTRYGEILTNLDVKFDEVWKDTKSDKWTEITAKPGKGPAYRFESKFGNVYLRKPN